MCRAGTVHYSMNGMQTKLLLLKPMFKNQPDNPLQHLDIGSPGETCATGTSDTMCQCRANVPKLHKMLKTHVGHKRPTTCRDLRYSSCISSIPKALPPLRFFYHLCDFGLRGEQTQCKALSLLFCHERGVSRIDEILKNIPPTI